MKRQNEGGTNSRAAGDLPFLDSFLNFEKSKQLKYAILKRILVISAIYFAWVCKTKTNQLDNKYVKEDFDR